MKRTLLLAGVAGLTLLAAPLAPPALAQSSTGAAVSAAAPATDWQEGLFGVRVDTARSRVLVRLPAAGENGVLGRYLYHPQVAAGLGMDGGGIDRSRIGQTQIVAFHRVGNRVQARFENHRFHALNADSRQEQAVADSFAPSVVWSGDIVETAADGSVTIDLTTFLERDVLNAAGSLRRARQGAYRLATNLGYVDVAETRVFPENIQFEVVQTFTADEPGAGVNRVAPDGRSVTIAVAQTFFKLPDDGFQPVPHDPRTGTSAQILQTDFAANLNQDVVSRLSRRFRLEKTDPGAARSTVKRPIVFYVDPAAPTAIRQALIEGGNWWAAAFDAAGYIDAFRVELLPEGVDPMDSRHNFVAWVHRETRGWSTGATVLDPRTGEIVRGVVQLGSLRDRQDKMIFEGLIGVSRNGTGAEDDPERLAYHRLRHLAAHEIGHTLGISHNYGASTFADRASVMDYPAPWVRADGDRLDFSRAYTTGVGAWDRFVIDWLYGAAPPGQSDEARRQALAHGLSARGYRFVADGDSRGPGGPHPLGVHWDNGEDALAEFANVMAVRRIALSRFGPDNIADGASMSELQRTLVPIYLYHRYQTVAAARQIAGVDYSYAVKGDGTETARVLPAERQRAALEALIAAVSPAELDLRDDLIDLLSSPQSGVGDRQFDTEQFTNLTGGTFDPSSAAATAAEVVLGSLLAPERLNRLVEQQRRDAAQLSLPELLDRVSAAMGPGAGALPGRHMELRRAARTRYVLNLAKLMGSAELSSTAQAGVRDAARRFGEQLGRCRGDRLETAHCAHLAGILAGSDEQLKAFVEADTLAIPPGAPI